MRHLFVLLLLGFNSFAANALTNAEPALSSDLESVVFFMSTQFDRNGGDEGLGLCNGNLISPRMMITAAHCVFMGEISGKKEIDIQVGEYRYVNRPSGERVRVGYAAVSREVVNGQVYLTSDLKRRMQSQKYRLNIGPSDDIAVVVFERDLKLKQNFQFTPVLSQNEVQAIVSKVQTYAPTVVTINFVEEVSTDTKRMARLESLKKTMSGYLESKSKGRVQPGDSGAPLFVRVGTLWKQLGVTKGRASTFFSDWDVYGLLDNKRCDISRQMVIPEDQKLLCF